MRILLFGGSFDPVHRGHMALLRAAARELRPDRIILLPSGRPPHKAPPAASFDDRVALLKAALKEPRAKSFARKVSIDRFEARGPGPHYTVRTLAHLRRKHPGAEFFLLMGSDQLAGFRSWREPGEILRLARLVVGRRRGSYPERSRRAEAHFLKGVFPPVSSTAVRTALSEGRAASKYLSSGVARELLRRGLYDSRALAWMRPRLKPSRLRHVFAVARTAAALARKHGLDVGKARQAALLHDAGRAFGRAALTAYVKERRLKVPLAREIARREPMLFHAYVSADLARRKFGVTDPEVLGAIARHTLGGRGMSPLEQLIYVADAGSEDRTFPRAKGIRAAGAKSLKAGVRAAAKAKLDWVARKKGWVHPLGVETLEWAGGKLKSKS